MNVTDLFIDQIQLARRWKLSHRTLECWGWIGCGPNYTKIGRRVVYRLVDVEKFEADGLHQITSAEGALLASPEGRGNILRASPLFAMIDAHIARTKPTLVVLDTLADLFGGDENQRAQARQFISLLRGWAIKNQTTILLLAHPSLSGMANGSGSSGNTAWNNSVRSRLYFERVTDSSAGKTLEPDPDARVLRTVKSNYGRTGGEIPLRWSNSILVPEVSDLGVDMRNAIAELRAEQVFE